jgi:hypothetical protein
LQYPPGGCIAIKPVGEPNRTPTRINREGCSQVTKVFLRCAPACHRGQDRLGSLSLLKKLIQGVLVVIVVVALQATKVLLGRA